MLFIFIASCTTDKSLQEKSLPDGVKASSKEIAKVATKNSEESKLSTSMVTSPQIFKDRAGEWSLGFSTPKQSPAKQLPLIVYLHGGVGTARTEKGTLAFEMFSFLDDDLDLYIASPSANRDAPWWSREGMERIYSSVNFMVANFNINPKRVYLAGVSDGATALFAIASQNSTPFAGFIGACGYPLMFGGQLNLTNLKQTSMLMFVSGQDRLYPSQPVIDYYKKLQESGVPINYKLYPNEEHGFSYKESEKLNIIEFITGGK
jgi:predicted peptidase